MNPSRARRMGPLVGLLLPILAVAVSGCYNPFLPRIAPALGRSQPAPVPSSAAGVLRLFEWCYNNKSIAEYREIFTDDYRFFFSPLDSAGAEYRGIPWTREDELISTTQLFVGGSADQPAASSIRLNLDKNFLVYADPTFVSSDARGRWHKNIRTQVVLQIQTGDGNAIDISGAANFYMVRGDSAVIPPDLQARGFGPDSNRWYIRRWDDETAQSGPGAFAARRAGGAGLATARGSDIARSPSPIPIARASTDVARPAALSDFPQVASWGYAKGLYLRQAGPTPLRRGATAPTR
jgi:hypothetical protein